MQTKEEVKKSIKESLRWEQYYTIEEGLDALLFKKVDVLEKIRTLQARLDVDYEKYRVDIDAADPEQFKNICDTFKKPDIK